MIVTIQAVFCVVKELLQSLLSYCHESYHPEDTCKCNVDAIESPKENGEPTRRRELQTNSHVQLSSQSSKVMSENVDIFRKGFNQSNNQENPAPHSNYTFLEEDWDNDIISNAHLSRTEPDPEPSNNGTFMMGHNSYLGVNGSKDLPWDETSSTHSSDSEACSASAQHFETDLATRSLHLVSERDWLDELESLYFSDMLTELKSLLPRAFEASRNCFDFVLYVIKFADFDIQAGKKSLAYMTLVELEAWLKLKTEGKGVQEVQKLGYWPTDNQKDLALEVVASSTFLLFEPVKRTFQLDSGNNSFLTKHVRFLMHSRKKYKEAATITYKLKLQRHFEVTEILLPLVILDKLQLAESYVASCPTSLQHFMKMIDELCVMTDDELEVVVEKTISPKPKEHRLKNKILVKLGERLVKMFHLKAENYPNIYKEKNLSGLRYLLSKKYSEKQPVSHKWDDLIEVHCIKN